MLYALLKLASYVFSNLLNKCDDTLYNIKFIPLNPFDFIYLKTCPKWLKNCCEALTQSLWCLNKMVKNQGTMSPMCLMRKFVASEPSSLKVVIAINQINFISSLNTFSLHCFRAFYKIYMHAFPKYLVMH